MGTAGECWIPPHIDLVSLCSQMFPAAGARSSREGSAHALAGSVAQPAQARLIFPAATSGMCSTAFPTPPELWAQGLMSPCPSPRLACSPSADPAALASSVPLLFPEGRGCWLWPFAPHSDHAQGSPEMQSLSPGPALRGHQTPLPKSLVPVPRWVSLAHTLYCA